ncbi:unnamed protein product [Diplocarpon coronariae]
MATFKGELLVGKSNYTKWINTASLFLEVNGHISYIDGSELPPRRSIYFKRESESSTYIPISDELSVRYYKKLGDFERASKKALGALKSIISLENQKRFRDKSTAKELFEAIKAIYNTKGLELISRYINKIVNNSYSSYKNVDKYTSAIQSSAIYLRQLKCPLPKPIIASLIFKGLLSSFDSFASRKYKEISSDLKHIDLESLINDLISKEAQMGANADYKAQVNKAFAKTGGKKNYCTHCKLSGHISEKCYKLHPELRPFNKKANKAKESKSNSKPKNDSSKTLISAWKKDSTTSIVVNKAQDNSTPKESHLSELSQITSIDNMKFVLDSGATKHYSPNKNWLINYKPVFNKAITIANGESMPILGKGDIPIKTKKGLNLLIEGVNLVPSLNTTLISSRELTKKDWSIGFSRDITRLKHPNISEEILLYQANTLNDIELYYKRLLHFNKELILKTVDNSIGLKKIQDTKLELDSIAYIKNRSYNSIVGKTPYKVLYGKKPNIDYIKILGSITYVLINKNQNKLAEKSDKGILIGFESPNNFLIYVPKNRAIISSKNVIIKENLTYSTPTDKENSDYTDFIEGIENTINNNRVLKRRGKAKDYSDYTPNVTIRAMANKQPNNSGTNIPGIFPETSSIFPENSSNLAITNNRLIEEEIKALSAFENATQLASQAFISYKADLSENIYSKPSTTKIIIAKEGLSEILEPKNYQEAINSAYKEYWLKAMQKELDSLEELNTWEILPYEANTPTYKPLKTRWVYKIKIYIAPPNGIYTSKYSNKLLKLNKALYGLKKSARLWFITLKEVLIQKLGFTALLADSCILYNKKLNIIICVYVDDLALIGPNINLIKSFIKGLEEYFKLKDLGPIKDYLGINIEYNQEKAGKLKNIPIEPKIKLEPNPNKATSNEITRFQQIIGSLLFLTLATRPDISYAVIKLARFASNPSENHIIAVKNLLRYLKGTKSLGLIYKNSPNKYITGYCDADYAGDIGSAKSTTGYSFYLANCLFSWKSKLQSIIAQSTTEAEYMAINSAAKEAVYIKQILLELGFYIQNKLPLYTDNNGALLLAKNPQFHERTKHIAVKYHYIRDLISKGEIDLIYINTLSQKADGFTKPLAKPQFVEFLKQLAIST